MEIDEIVRQREDKIEFRFLLLWIISIIYT